MFLTKKNLVDVHQTAAEMRRLSCRYCSDLGGWLCVPFLDYYRHICELPYYPDPPEVETVSRPLYTLMPDYSPRDCDDKSVLIASWLHAHGDPVRFVATSTKPDGTLCHVFVQMQNGLLIDATYPQNAEFLGDYPYFRDVTRFEALTGWF